MTPAVISPVPGVVFPQPTPQIIELSTTSLESGLNGATEAKALEKPRFQYPTLAERKHKITEGLNRLNPLTPYQEWEEVQVRHKILLLFIAVFSALTVAMLVAVLSSRFYKLGVQARTEKLKKRFELLLMHVLFFEDAKPTVDWDQDKIVQHFKKNYLKSTFKRKILIAEILDLNKNFTGQFAENLRLLFLYLNLEKDSFALLKSSQWNLKAQGICELAQMLVYEAAPYIKKLINHPNDLVRMESHIALVKLDKRRGMAFLPHLHRSFTQWQQLNLQHALSKLDREDIPDFSEYLGSSNVQVVEFSLKMIGIYNQVDALPAVEQLLKHPEERVRLTTIETIQQLDAAHAVPALMAYFPAANKVNQVAILRAIASLGGAPVEFFTEQLLSGDHALRVVAAKALHDAQQLEAFQMMQAKVMDAQLQQIIRHALDHRN
ncbi:hypothetical protein GCM10023183_03330 [Nibribacter koreensis]|uniref:HEAT repeat domain-containing protein n=2 Tax=Nibribacter koreensis TaxID=1084519 RepID=A0ABP8F6T9_9BACT